MYGWCTPHPRAWGGWRHRHMPYAPWGHLGPLGWYGARLWAFGCLHDKNHLPPPQPGGSWAESIYRRLGCKPTAPLVISTVGMVGAVLGLFVRPLQRNEARRVRRVHAAARAGRRRGGGAGGGRESQHVGASTAHGRRSGTRCRGKATVHPATGRAITRASACDVRTAQQTRAPRAGSSSSKPAATRCLLLAPDLIRGSLPVSPRTPLLPAVSQDRYRGQSWT